MFQNKNIKSSIHQVNIFKRLCHYYYCYQFHFDEVFQSFSHYLFFSEKYRINLNELFSYTAGI